MKKEIWKDVPKYVGYYQVSNLGSVRSVDRFISNGSGVRFVNGKLISPYLDDKGYYRLSLNKNGVRCNIRLHQLIAVVFLGYTMNGKMDVVVDHIDNNKKNNKLENLQLITHRENCLKSLKHRGY